MTEAGETWEGCAHAPPRRRTLAMRAASGMGLTPFVPIHRQGLSSHDTSTSDIIQSHPDSRRPLPGLKNSVRERGGELSEHPQRAGREGWPSGGVAGQGPITRCGNTRLSSSLLSVAIERKVPSSWRKYAVVAFIERWPAAARGATGRRARRARPGRGERETPGDPREKVGVGAPNETAGMFCSVQTLNAPSSSAPMTSGPRFCRSGGARDV